MSKKYIKELISMSDDQLSTELENVEVSVFRDALNRALKEQDRDTRHACAEAMLLLDYYTNGDGISKASSHNACMNTRAV